jgi:hypothetical protein
MVEIRTRTRDLCLGDPMSLEILNSKWVMKSYIDALKHWSSSNLWTQNLSNFICIGLVSWLFTVGNRMDEIPGSDSSEKCFWIFCSIVNTPTKEKPQHVSPCCPPLLWYRPGKSKLGRIRLSFFAAERSNLEANTSGCVQILFSIYILVWKVFRSAFQNRVFGKFVRFLVFKLEVKM